jgi:hypothetical protein
VPAPILNLAENSQRVREVYAELAERPIERACDLRTECCQFKLTGAMPFLTKAEAFVAAQAYRAAGRKKLPASTDGKCPMLEPDGKCLIYADRPFGCRTHFCRAAGGPYARRDVVDLIHRLEKLSGPVDAQPLPAAVKLALQELEMVPRPGRR